MEGKAKAELDDRVVIGGSLMHSETRDPDFSGYVTKYGLLCSDGRTILSPAFEHQDKARVPLVWHHNGKESPENVLGHMDLEHRDDGVYGYGFFNGTEPAVHAKTLVEHGDIEFLSIYANELTEQAKQVKHGIIREASLVMAGANPGAMIDNVAIQHADGIAVLDDEAVIYTDIKLEHENKKPEPSKTDDGPTVEEVFETMSEEQKEVVHMLVDAALEKQDNKTPEATHSSTEEQLKNDGKDVIHMTRNLFEQQGGASGTEERLELSHDAVREIATDAKALGSLKHAVEKYALKHGIDNIDVLFPDAKAIDSTPEFDKRRTEWVAGVLNGVRKAPFSRIKSLTADLTHDEARAKGYIKGNFKKEEFFGLAKRVTTPTTVYKKQKLDRDDIIDITDLDVVAWLKGEMRLMLDEELARAVLIGDGREADDEDKIRDPAGANEGAGIRAIANDHDLYAATITVPNNNLDTDAEKVKFVETVMLNMGLYKGSGSPTFYTTLGTLNKLILAKDGMGRRLWRSASDLATEMGVASIVTVEVMEDEDQLVGIIVNLRDYTIGTDRGGDIAMFDDFDIDYNQYKYLIETRASGALTKIRSALVIRFGDVGDTEVAPEEPLFDVDTGDIVVPTTANVVYQVDGAGADVSGDTITVPAGEAVRITSKPDATHFFQENVNDEWTFDRPAA